LNSESLFFASKVRRPAITGDGFALPLGFPSLTQS
jgi:hypothetical protein